MEQQLNKHDALHHKRLRSFQRASISAALAKQNAERSQSELDETKLKVSRLHAGRKLYANFRASFSFVLFI